MPILLGIILTIVIFTSIVFIHELGHFIAARLTGMKVEEFGIGLPPQARILTKDKKGTVFTLNWLPIGGFVRIQGEDPGGVDSQKKDSFGAKKWWARSLVLLAGVTMNFILAIVIFTGLFMSAVQPLMPNFLSDTSYNSFFLPSIEESLSSGYLEHDGIVLTPLTGGLAESLGIMPGDVVREVDTTAIISPNQLITFIKDGKAMEWKIDRNGEEKILSVTPKDGRIESYITYKNISISKSFEGKYSFSESFVKAGKETFALSHMTLDLLGSTLRKLIAPRDQNERKQAVEHVSGPIGMGSGFVTLVEEGVQIKLLFIIIAFLSINLGVLNILPFPALDGGRFISTTVRSIVSLFTTRRTLLDTLEYSFHALGMIILLAASLLIAFSDIFKLF